MFTCANDVPMEHQTLLWANGLPGPTVGTVVGLKCASGCAVEVSGNERSRPVRRVVAQLGSQGEGDASAPDTSGALVALSGVDGRPEGVVERVSGLGASLLVVSAHDARPWLEAARAAGLPTIVAPDPHTVEAIRTTALELLVEHQGALLDREDSIHHLLERIVLAGGSLDELCHALAHFFRGSAIVTSTDGRVLASAGVDDDLARVTALECFDKSGRLLVEEEPLGLRAHGDDRDHRALVRIVAGGGDLGLLGAFTPGRAFSETDLHMLLRAATVAALAVTKEQAVAAVESKYRAEFLRDVLVGRAGEPAEAIAHAAALGWDIDRRLVVVVAETDENDAETTRSSQEVRALQERFTRAWTWAVRTKDASIPVAGFSQEVVALVPVAEDADTASIMRAVGEFVRMVRGDGGGGRRSFSTGVSRPIDGVAGLATAYAEGLKAVSVGRQMHGHSALTHFDGLGIYRLLALVPDSADLRRFVVESLGELVTDDTAEHADLRHTLSVLLDTNLNVAETARQLFFHYNTLRYRIAKLERMLGPFTTDPQLRLTLALALRVHEMHGI